MASYYYSLTGEDVLGPVPGLEIWTMLESGRLPLDTRICREGSEVWSGLDALESAPDAPRQPPASPPLAALAPAAAAPEPKAGFPIVPAGITALVGGLALVMVFAYPSIHNADLRERLGKCQSHKVLGADAYYESAMSSDVVVFDIAGKSSSDARRIDAVNLLMQFATKLDLSGVRRVVLAREGKPKFYLDASDIQRLASSYDNGGRLWAFDHLPERCCDLSGAHPYGTWTGGWLGVAEHQAADLDSLLEAWSD